MAGNHVHNNQATLAVSNMGIVRKTSPSKTGAGEWIMFL
jgi:hypothetical protein